MSENRSRRILIVDDDPDTLGLLRSLCRESGFDVDEAVDGEGALEKARSQRPDLVLLDMVLPDATGLEVLHALRADPRLGGLPVVIVSARRDRATKVAALDAGANDYLLKPFELEEVLARIRTQFRQREYYERLERSNIELRLANARLEELATTDELTGLSNARHFRDRLEEEFLRAERYETPLALVMSDLDGFKAVNDEHGHQAGDRLLALVAQRLVAQARATDIVCRYGGDEFAFLLPHTALHEAERFARRLSDRIAQAPLRLPAGKLARIGLSCGVASLPETRVFASAKELFVAADEALYRAKETSKGGVIVASSATDAESPAAPTPVARDSQRSWPRTARTPSGVEAV